MHWDHAGTHFLAFHELLNAVVLESNYKDDPVLYDIQWLIDLVFTVDMQRQLGPAETVTMIQRWNSGRFYYLVML